MNNAMYRTFQNNRDSLLFSLSGGLDSRYVVAFARQFGVNPVLAYTIGPDNSEDQIYARQVADILDIKQRSYVAAPDTLWKDACRFSYFSDGMSTIQGPILSLSMLEEDYPKYQATITSQMCDAVFGSTLWRKKIKILLEKTSIDKESTSILFSIYNLSSDEQLKNIFTKEYYSDIKDTYKDVIQGYLNQGIKRPFHVYYHLMFNEHGRRGTLCGNLVHNLFVETRMPSYDNDLLEFAFNLPIALRQFQYLYRLVFTRKFPLLARVKREYYNLPISADNWRFNFKTWENKIITKLKETPLQAVFKNIKRYNRPKYVSYDYWFKNELKDQVKDILFDKRIINRGIYNPSGLEKLFSDHMNSSVDNSGLIWQIINLEYFYRRFID
jgi:asparagine synthase (glutamine-hydrolysing)